MPASLGKGLDDQMKTGDGLTSATSSDLWNVQLAGEEGAASRSMTLEQLDAAFDEGIVNADTLVREAGHSEWTKLGRLAGLEAPEMAPNSISPVAAEIRSPAEVRSAPAVEDDEPVAFRANKRGVVAGLVGVTVVLAGIVLAVTKFGGTPTPAAAAALAAPPPETTAIPEAPKARAFVESATPQLTDQQKRAMQEADRNREEAQRRKPKAPRPAAGPKKANDPGSSVFHEGGDHDPLGL